MARYRKKPVVVEAVQFRGRETIPLRWRNEGRFHIVMLGNRWYAEIPTMEGTMVADEGDWIIRGVKGEFYPCKPDVFAATYEPEEPA